MVWIPHLRYNNKACPTWDEQKMEVAYVRDLYP